MGASSFLQTLEHERPTFTVELGINLPDEKPAAVVCRDLGPKQWWSIPNSKGLPVLVQQLHSDDRTAEDWDDEEKLDYWEYLRHVCRQSICKVRDVQETGENKFTERWLGVEFVDDPAQAGVFGDVLKMTVDQFDVGDNIARVGQQVLFFRELRRADGGPVRGGTEQGKPDRVRKSRKGKRTSAT